MNDFGFYFGLGWGHIMSIDALDHILFVWVLAAIYLLRDWKQVLILVTAFTIGHSITLALSVLDLIDVPAEWTEFFIPVTIAITALVNIFRKEYTTRHLRLNYILALLFGLVHGLGFANTLRSMLLVKGQSLGWSLFGFNVGLEAGQLVVVAVILLLASLVVDRLRAPRREWVLFVSAGVFSLALKMALERLPS
ncbi:HupE/UreJ family protein [Flaviaesturariibacter amylovorans]|uniref:HupE/UreJ family protein n=1 Tax=Flaviaesturariibacter amylovorans TaxID=1084520 RepID=A0ABP8GI92_9BACT